MFAKLATLSVLLVLLGIGLLTLRQQRLEMANRTVELYWQIQKTRQQTWDVERQTASLLRPLDLKVRIADAKLDLEPFDPIGSPEPKRSLAQGEALTERVR